MTHGPLERPYMATTSDSEGRLARVVGERVNAARHVSFASTDPESAYLAPMP
jgi:hypothetical protein